MNLKMSELLKQALEDLRELEQDPDYQIHMKGWHHVREDKCLVCLGGAYLACRVMDKAKVHIFDLGDLNTDVQRFLKTLDWLRRGDIYMAYRVFHNSNCIPDWCRSVNVTHYEDSKADWHRDMNFVLELLERNGE